MITKKFLLLASLSGMIAVILGAFGAHFLKRILSPELVQIFETGVRYQFYHTFALLVVAMLGRYLNEGWIAFSGWLFVAGIILFSGSLYLMALVDSLGMGAIKGMLGPMTPIGGFLFIGGWLSLFRASFDYKKQRHHKSSKE